jgi:hypothetical protein
VDPTPTWDSGRALGSSFGSAWLPPHSLVGLAWLNSLDRLQARVPDICRCFPLPPSATAMAAAAHPRKESAGNPSRAEKELKEVPVSQ